MNAAEKVLRKVVKRFEFGGMLAALGFTAETLSSPLRLRLSFMTLDRSTNEWIRLTTEGALAPKAFEDEDHAKRFVTNAISEMIAHEVFESLRFDGDLVMNLHPGDNGAIATREPPTSVVTALLPESVPGETLSATVLRLVRERDEAIAAAMIDLPA